ncbi:MAG: hypothetical protein JOZ72_09735 [Alphaproteobacteria bacterium]|nr:hypothetical protein [Alphaproteobacteria bacterium]
MLRLFPLLAIPVIIYNFVAFGGNVAGHDVQNMITSTFSIRMFSGDEWKISFADFLLFFALAVLFIEVIKATRTTSREIINHGLSMLVFVVTLIEFIVLKGFATSTFFFLTMYTLFDVIAGYTISIVAAEHDLGLGKAGTD